MNDIIRTLPTVPGLNASRMGWKQNVGHSPNRTDPQHKVRTPSLKSARPTGGRVADRGNPGNPKPRHRKRQPQPGSRRSK